MPSLWCTRTRGDKLRHIVVRAHGRLFVDGLCGLHKDLPIVNNVAVVFVQQLRLFICRNKMKLNLVYLKRTFLLVFFDVEDAPLHRTMAFIQNLGIVMHMRL